MFIQFMHFSSLQAPFSSISKIFIHPKHGGTGSGGSGLGGTGSGRVGSGRIGAGLTGPACAVQLNRIPPVRLLDSFIFFLCAALLSTALRSTPQPNSVSLSITTPTPLYNLRRKGARPFFSTPSLLSSRCFTLTPSAPPRPGCCPCFALLGFACACVYALRLICFSTSLFQYFTTETSLKVVYEAKANRGIGNRTHIGRSYPLLHI